MRDARGHLLALGSTLLAKVDAPVGPRLRGPSLADVVVARASDGYRVVLSLGDIDPTIRSEREKGPVILADKEDGKPMGRDGPFRLAVGGDLKPARAARNVVELDVQHLP